MMDRLSEELDFPFQRNGSLVLCFDKAQLPELEALAERGRQNGVSGLRIVSGDELKELEPAVSDQAAAALFCPTGGIVCPFNMTVAYAENAFENGAQFLFNTAVKQILPGTTPGSWRVVTASGETFETRCIVNAAGVYADELHNMVSARRLSITPRRGEYQLLDKKAGTSFPIRSSSFPAKWEKASS